MRTSHVVTFLAACAIVAMGFLTVSVRENKAEQAAIAATPTDIKPFESRSSEWGKYYPREYSTYMQTKQSDTLQDMLKEHPAEVIIWAGYAFAKDYNAPRGHYYMQEDNSTSLRTGSPDGAEKHSPLPTACWTCKSPDVPRVMARDGELEYYTGKWDKYGTEMVNPLGCADCHNPKTMELTLTRPYVARGLDAEGTLKAANVTHQDMRSLVCAQCHVEYYFHATKWTKDGEEKTAMVVTLPWNKGYSVDDMEKYYDEIGFFDWKNKFSRTPMLKAQHPEYETFLTSDHYRAGLSCADCHMPYVREGAVKYSNHNVGSPLDNIGVTCLNCHKESESEFRKLLGRKLQRKNELSDAAMEQVATAHLEAARAWELGATEEEMAPVLSDLRKGSWRWDYAAASHGAFFHAPEETLHTFARALEYGQAARLKLRAILAKYGDPDYVAPDFSTKEKAQALVGIDYAGESAAKKVFLESLREEWLKTAEKNGVYDPKSREGMGPRKTSWQ